MNIWFGLFTLAFVGITVYIGRDTTEVMEIILLSMVMGVCFLISVMHAYNKLFAANTYESIGETRKPKSFGNDYWE